MIYTSIVIVFIVLCLIFVYALCGISKRSDERANDIYMRIIHEKNIVDNSTVDHRS
jgi:hypothetical protein